MREGGRTEPFRSLTFRQKEPHPCRDLRGNFLWSGVPAVRNHLKAGAAEAPDKLLAFPERDDGIVSAGKDKQGMIEIVVGGAGKSRIAHGTEKAIPSVAKAFNEKIRPIHLGIRLSEGSLHMKGPPREAVVAFRIREKETDKAEKELFAKGGADIPRQRIKGRCRADKDELADPQRMQFCESRGDGGTVGMRENIAFANTEGVEDAGDEIGLMVETVVLLAPGALGQAEAVQVDRDELEAFLEKRCEVAERIMRGSEPVQQEERPPPARTRGMNALSVDLDEALRRDRPGHFVEGFQPLAPHRRHGFTTGMPRPFAMITASRGITTRRSNSIRMLWTRPLGIVTSSAGSPFFCLPRKTLG